MVDSMTKFNEIQYKLDKISNLIDDYKSGWDNKRNSLLLREDSFQKLNDRERNPIIGVCAGFVPILLVIFSMDKLVISELVMYLTIDFIVMLGFFFFYAIYNYKNSMTNVRQEKILLDSIQNLESLKIHLDETSVDITQFNKDNTDIVFVIAKLTQADANLRYFTSLKSAIKDRFLHPETKKQFIEIIESGKIILMDDIEYYKIVKDTVKVPEWKAFEYLYENLTKELKSK